MRRLLLIVLLLLGIMAGTAAAEIYKFNGPEMFIELSDTVYNVQLTANNIDTMEAEIVSRGKTLEEMKQRFENEGLLLLAYDDKNGRTVTVTAVRDAKGQEIYDIDAVTPDDRSVYRANHKNGTLMGGEGYSVESAEWKKFGTGQDRFLMIKYTRKLNGTTTYGLIRKTIKNGYSITVDMQTGSRKVASADITALNKIQDTIAFSATENTEGAEPELALTFSVVPPELTNTAAFSIKGTTLPGATVVAAYVSLKYNQSKVMSVMADGKGVFQFDIVLPREDLYNLLVSVVNDEGGENEKTIEKSFQTEYNAGLIPVTFTSTFPTEFTGDSFKLAGTTETGVTVQLSVNGVNTSKKTGSAKTFSFTVDTSAEGTYTIMLTFSKKGYDTRIFNYTIERHFSAEQQKTALAKTAKRPEYTDLKNQPDNYYGKVVHVSGYIVSLEEGSGEWRMTYAVKKSGSTYKNMIMVLCSEKPECEIGQQIDVYGYADGLYKTQGEDGSDVTWPKIKFLFFK